MKLYKLTTQDGYTRKGCGNQCLWGENITHSGTGIGDLCGPGYIHAYTHPKLAVVLNPIHANVTNPLLWVCEGEVVKEDSGLKVGCVSLTTLRRIELPVVTLEQRVRFGILCAKEVCANPEWVQWADNWLSGKDRTASSAFLVYPPSYAAAPYAASSAAISYAGFATYVAACSVAACSVAACAATYVDLIKLIEEATCST
jgi:hypothetical protein